MEVYIVTNEWQNDNGEHESNILGVYSTLEKAQFKLKEAYDYDVKWIEEYGPSKEEFEECSLDEMTSFVLWDEFWSSNSIIKQEVK